MPRARSRRGTCALIVLMVAVHVAAADAQRVRGRRGGNRTGIARTLSEGWRWRGRVTAAEHRINRLFDPKPGMLFAATKHAVLRYDGYSWHEIADVPCVGVRWLRCFAGGFLAASSRELWWFDERGARRRLSAVEDGHLLISPDQTPGEGRFVFHANGRVFTVRDDLSLETVRLFAAENRVSGIHESEDGTLYIACAREAVRFIGDDATRSGLPDGVSSFGERVAITRIGSRLLFVPNGPYFTSAIGVWEGDRLVSLPLDYRTTSTHAAALTSLVPLPDDEFILCLGSGEMYVRSRMTWVPIRRARARQQEIVQALATRHRFFLLTGAGFIDACDLTSSRWEFESLTSRGLSRDWDIINALDVAPNGDVWVASDAGVLRWRDGKVRRRWESAGPTVGLDHATTVQVDGDRVLTGSGGTFRGVFELVGDDWRPLEGAPPLVRRSKVHRIKPGRRGDLWFCLLLDADGDDGEAGVACRRDGEWITWTHDELPARRVYDVATDGVRTWVASRSGLFVLEPGRPWRLESGHRWSAFTVARDQAGRLWTGRGRRLAPIRVLVDGVWREAADGVFKMPPAAAGLVAAGGHVWALSGFGLVRFDGLQGHAVSAEPHLGSIEGWAIAADEAGGVWIGTRGAGLVRHHPDDRVAPRVVHVAADVANDDESVLLRWTSRDQWDVSPPSRLRHRVRVDDSGWSDWFTAPERRFSDLDIGDHVIAIQSMDLLGNVSTSRQVAVSIPGLTARRIAWTIGILASAVIGLGGALTLRTRVSRRRRESHERSLLEESERHHRDLVEGGDMVLMRFGPSGRLEYISPQIRRMVGQPAERLLASPRLLDDAVHEEDRSAYAALARARREVSDTPVHVEFRVSERADTWRWLHVRQSVRHGPDGGVVGWDAVAVDFTERKELEAALHQAQKMEGLGLLAGGIAHDFNNILVGVLGNVDLLEDVVASDPAAAHALQDVRIAAERAAELCQQMLAYAGKASARLRLLDLRAEVEGVRGLLRSSVPKSTHLTVFCADSVSAIQGDPVQLGQVITNLVLNASEAYEGREGAVEVTVEERRVTRAVLDQSRAGTTIEPGTFVAIEVRDYGAGIAENDLDRIFDPFFTTRFDGRGLGLAAVAGIVTAHRGAILVRSAVGEGTTFTVLLPAVDQAVFEESSRDVSVPALPEGLTVLIIDDEPLVGAVARSMLARFGARGLIAHGGTQGVEMLRGAGGVDAVLLDMTMPDMNGAEAFAALRRIDPAIPVVVASGYAEDEVRAMFDGDQPGAFLHKPFTSVELARALVAVIGSEGRPSGSGGPEAAGAAEA